MKKFILLVVAALLFTACGKEPEEPSRPNPTEPQETFVDGEIISNIVTDFDGNAYNGIVVGNQIWMQENLHTTHYADGTPIPMSDEVSVEFAYCYYPDNDSANVTEYGYLYNWKAAMRDSESSTSVPSGVQGVCPNGWHLPSDAEWVQLLDHLSNEGGSWCGGFRENNAKALAGQEGWNISNIHCAVGNNPSANNFSGMGIMPAGYFYQGNYYNFGNYAICWSSTEFSPDDAYTFDLYYNYPSVYRNGNYKYIGFSVRCLRD